MGTRAPQADWIIARLGTILMLLTVGIAALLILVGA